MGACPQGPHHGPGAQPLSNGGDMVGHPGINRSSRTARDPAFLTAGGLAEAPAICAPPVLLVPPEVVGQMEMLPGHPDGISRSRIGAATSENPPKVGLFRTSAEA